MFFAPQGFMPGNQRCYPFADAEPGEDDERPTWASFVPPWHHAVPPCAFAPHHRQRGAAAPTYAHARAFSGCPRGWGGARQQQQQHQRCSPPSRARHSCHSRTSSSGCGPRYPTPTDDHHHAHQQQGSSHAWASASAYASCGAPYTSCSSSPPQQQQTTRVRVRVVPVSSGPPSSAPQQTNSNACGPPHTAVPTAHNTVPLSTDAAARTIQRLWRGWRLRSQAPVLKRLAVQQAALASACTLLQQLQASTQGPLSKQQVGAVQELAMQVMLALDQLPCPRAEVRAVRRRLVAAALQLQDQAVAAGMQPSAPPAAATVPAPASSLLELPDGLQTPTQLSVQPEPEQQEQQCAAAPVAAEVPALVTENTGLGGAERSPTTTTTAADADGSTSSSSEHTEAAGSSWTDGSQGEKGHRQLQPHANSDVHTAGPPAAATQPKDTAPTPAHGAQHAGQQCALTAALPAGSDSPPSVTPAGRPQATADSSDAAHDCSQAAAVTAAGLEEVSASVAALESVPEHRAQHAGQQAAGTAAVPTPLDDISNTDWDADHAWEDAAQAEGVLSTSPAAVATGTAAAAVHTGADGSGDSGAAPACVVSEGSEGSWTPLEAASGSVASSSVGGGSHSPREARQRWRVRLNRTARAQLVRSRSQRAGLEGFELV